MRFSVDIDPLGVIGGGPLIGRGTHRENGRKSSEKRLA